MKISPNIEYQNKNNSTNHYTKTITPKQIVQTNINSSDSIEDIINNILPDNVSIEAILNINLKNHPEPIHTKSIHTKSIHTKPIHTIQTNTILEPSLDSHTYIYKSVFPLNYPFVKYFNSNPKIYGWLTCLFGLIHIIVIFFGIRLNPLISYIYIICSTLILNYLYFAKADIYIIKQIIKTWDFIFLSLQIAFFQVLSSIYYKQYHTYNNLTYYVAIMSNIISISMYYIIFMISDTLDVKRIYKIILWLFVLIYIINSRYHIFVDEPYDNNSICILYEECATVRTVVTNLINFILITLLKHFIFLTYKSDCLIFYKSDIIKKNT